MRKLLSVVLLCLCLLAPVQRLDVAKLEPVQTVAVYIQNGQIVLETDTGDKGRGVDANQALADLKENAVTVIYLDTAQYLLVGEGAEAQAEQLRPYLKGSVRVAAYGGGDVARETAYWETHGNLPRFKSWKGL